FRPQLLGLFPLLALALLRSLLVLLPYLLDPAVAPQDNRNVIGPNTAGFGPSRPCFLHSCSRSRYSRVLLFCLALWHLFVALLSLTFLSLHRRLSRSSCLSPGPRFVDPELQMASLSRPGLASTG